ncbi:MAG: hypothetical protein CM15mP64_6560 [Candidatus Neomarinimicrobiota bacterium]|nr:MAG: hypothetical protein CM15mP64_6560 [Candidatus Neomarinimicrobiota bacterium]
MAAAVVVVSIIAIGMTSGAQAVMLHYQSDTVRQDLRQYGNQIMREIARELNLAQKLRLMDRMDFQELSFTNTSQIFHQNLQYHVSKEQELNSIIMFRLMVC